MIYKIRPLYTGLRVRNLKRSIRFYKALRFRLTLRVKTPIGEFAQLEHPSSGFTVELNYFPRNSEVYEPLKRGTELDHFGFHVDDVDRWVHKLLAAGGRLKIKPSNSQIMIHPEDAWVDGRGAYVADPDGVWIELLGPPK